MANFYGSNNVDDTILGTSGNDRMYGRSGHDVLRGGGGHDRLYGEGGDDRLVGGAGNDRIDGGNGIDTAQFDLAVTVDLATGTATGEGSDTLFSIENVTGSNFADIISGNTGSNTLLGGGGADRLYGRDGNDVLRGGAGDDQLWGGLGSDTLIADGGNDYLVGDEGYFGSIDAHPDIFVIAATSGRIIVADFDQGQDLIDFSFYGFGQNGQSAYWSASAQQDGFDTVMTLTGQNAELVTIILQGVVYGHQLTLADMIGGSANLIPAVPPFPINGGNGVADIFVIDPLDGDRVIDHFEDGLDKLNISDLMAGGWGGYLSNRPDGSVELNFSDGLGGDFTVTLTGVMVPQIDMSDYIF